MENGGMLMNVDFNDEMPDFYRDRLDDKKFDKSKFMSTFILPDELLDEVVNLLMYTNSNTFKSMFSLSKTDVLSKMVKFILTLNSNKNEEDCWILIYLIIDEIKLGIEEYYFDLSSESNIK